MKTIYQVNNQVSNYSDVVATFDTEEEAFDYISEAALNNCDEDEMTEEDNRMNNEIQLQTSYYSIEAIKVDLYTQIVDEEECKAYGEDIIDTFYNGNFSQGIEQLKEVNVCAIEFGNYIEELCNDLGYDNMSDFANNHFDYNFFICLGREL